MTVVSRYIEDVPYKHWNQCTLAAYIYDNVVEPKLFRQLENLVVLQMKGKTLTYGTHRTMFPFNGQTKKIVHHQQNAREQQFVYDMTFERNWWLQTTDTIKEWSDLYLKHNVNPVFYKFLEHIQTLDPFHINPNNWIPYRWHMNFLDHSKYLDVHVDSNPQYFNTKDCCSARIISLTFYLQDYEEGCGGDLYTLSGFRYKPKKNTAIGFNGHQVYHGVNANTNPNKKPRLAFTTRWAHKEDLYLPGHFDKALYKLEW